LVKHTSYEAPYYADFSSLPSISLSVRDQISYPFKATGKIKFYIF